MLTEKEREILELRRKGLRQVEIAKKLKISQPAVSSFEANAVKKITEAHATLDFVRKVGLKPENFSHAKKRQRKTLVSFSGLFFQTYIK